MFAWFNDNVSVVFSNGIRRCKAPTWITRGRRRRWNLLPVRVQQYRKTNHSNYLIFSDSGRWLTFCQKAWTHKEAQVVCRQLGYPNVAKVDIKLGKYNDPQVTVTANCTGQESRLDECMPSNLDGNMQLCQEAAVSCGKHCQGVLINVVTSYLEKP